MKFKYAAIDSKGAETSGEVEAENQAAAISAIRSKGLFPTRVVEVGGKASKEAKGRKAMAKTVFEKDGSLKARGKTMLGIVLTVMAGMVVVAMFTWSIGHAGFFGALFKGAFGGAVAGALCAWAWSVCVPEKTDEPEETS